MKLKLSNFFYEIWNEKLKLKICRVIKFALEMRMLIFVLVVSMATTTVRCLTCRGEDGQPVDW